MAWFLAVLALTYFGIGVFLAKGYYLRRHGVVATSGDRGRSTAGFIGLSWPVTVWFAGIRDPEMCKHHHHALERTRIQGEIDLIQQYQQS